PDDTGHIWEALSPHPSCIPKRLKVKASLEETSCGSIKLASCKSFKINHARRKMWNCKFPHVSTVMWPSPPTLWWRPSGSFGTETNDIRRLRHMVPCSDNPASRYQPPRFASRHAAEWFHIPAYGCRRSTIVQPN